MTGNLCDRHTGALAVWFDVWFSWQKVVINCPRTLCSAVIGHFPKMVQEPPPTSALGCHRGYLSSMPCQLPLTWDITNYSHTHTLTPRVRKAQDTCQGLLTLFFFFFCVFYHFSPSVIFPCSICYSVRTTNKRQPSPPSLLLFYSLALSLFFLPLMCFDSEGRNTDMYCQNKLKKAVC